MYEDLSRAAAVMRYILDNNYYDIETKSYVVNDEDFDPLELLEFFLPYYSDMPFYLHGAEPILTDDGWYCRIIFLCVITDNELSMEINEAYVYYPEEYDFYYPEEEYDY